MATIKHIVRSSSNSNNTKTTPKQTKALYDVSLFNNDSLQPFVLKKTTVIHRKRRLHVPSNNINLLFQIQPSKTITHAPGDKPTNGVVAMMGIQSHAMIALKDLTIRDAINDGAFDFGLLQTPEATTSSVGFVAAWNAAMTAYFDSNAMASTHWNVVEGYGNAETAKLQSSCLLLSTRAISASEELSICYGSHYWLKEIVHCVTAQTLLGYWFVLQCHLRYDTSLSSDMGVLDERPRIIDIAERIHHRMIREMPAWSGNDSFEFEAAPLAALVAYDDLMKAKPVSVLSLDG